MTLFTTPPDIARRLVRLADIQAGQRILEPSAGTGNLIHAIWDATAGADTCRLSAVEIHADLAARLRHLRDKMVGANSSNFFIYHCDFLQMEPADLGNDGVDRVVMNPPFDNGSDIAQVLHARTFLKAGGLLAAIVAAGPRQRAKLEPLASEWIDLPAGSFESVGTSVNTAIVIIGS